ncbi:MAG TPA: phytoene/squalene synthase family protein [Steroidobacteraceae bacterium]|nr:phytoene/squalene synthase family protein [Steroidobacteraceae bacterium]
MESSISDEAYQDYILPGVSRTFALTIPELPAALRTSVTNAYLLCRIADTIEDEPALSPTASLHFLQRFVAVLYGNEPAAVLAQDLVPQLSKETLPAEHGLVANMERVVRVTNRLDGQQRLAIQRCVEVMAGGMHQFQQTASLRGVPRLSDLDDYCYYVAGVVGQMLTELFCGYSAGIGQHRAAMHELDVSFAQGLQMTNILKDVWEDRSRGACWLPQEVFSRHGIDLGTLAPGQADSRFDAAMRELVGVAHAHLRNALAFTLLIPGKDAGIRRFCLWAIGLAVLTLRKITETPGFTSGKQVKVPRSAVAVTRITTNISVRSNWMLRRLFNIAARGVPLAPPGTVRRPSRPALLHGAAPAAPEYAHAARPVQIERGARRSEGRSAL